MAKKIIFASGKGGVGKSTLTAGIAVSLCKMGFKTLVIDFDIGMGCLDLILSADTNGLFNWGDVIDGNCDAVSALRQTDGPSLLVAPQSFSELYTSAAVRTMIKEYNDMFDYILMDAPAGVSGGFILAAESADSGIIVSTPDNVCVRVGGYAADKLFEHGMKDVRLVINRFDKKLVTKGSYLNIDEVIDATYLQLIGVVPSDKVLALACVSGIKNFAKSPACSALDRISQRINGKNINLKI